jgi:hypothetical protein
MRWQRSLILLLEQEVPSNIRNPRKVQGRYPAREEVPVHATHEEILLSRVLYYVSAT